MLDYIANCFLHFGWAIWGETCDSCETSTFNRLALFFRRFDEVVEVEEWEDGTRAELVEHGFGRVRYPVGRFITMIATEMDDRLDSVDL